MSIAYQMLKEEGKMKEAEKKMVKVCTVKPVKRLGAVSSIKNLGNGNCGPEIC
jgi:hypothetical protein